MVNGIPDQIIKIIRIKKIFFNRILTGEKTIEWRDYKDFYKRLFSPKPTHLIFHYQSKEKIIVTVKKIQIVKRPSILNNSIIPFGEKVFKISLGEVKKI